METRLQSSDFQLIRKLVEIPGLPGRESLVAELIKEALPKQSWQIQMDPIGNLTARKPGSGPKVLIIAHMDEVGLIVRRITSEGFLKVERLGGISVHVLPGSSLDLWTDHGRLDALVGAKPAHLVNGNIPSTPLEDLFIDIGASSKKEALSLGVNVGDGLTWKSDFCRLPGNRIRGKALDDRLGCFALVKIAEKMAEMSLDNEIMLGFVTQEENMILESAPIVHAYQPDIVIGVDGTLPFDTPEVDEPQCDIALGKGPCIKLMDAIRGKTAYLPSWDLTKDMMRFMAEKQIPNQLEVISGLSTALSLVPFMNNGIRTACLSLPIRYHHSAVEVADINDLELLLDALLSMCSSQIFG